MREKFAVYVEGDEYAPDEKIDEFDNLKDAKKEAKKQANFGFKEKFYILKYRKVFEIEG